MCLSVPTASTHSVRRGDNIFFTFFAMSHDAKTQWIDVKECKCKQINIPNAVVLLHGGGGGGVVLPCNERFFSRQGATCLPIFFCIFFSCFLACLVFVVIVVLCSNSFKNIPSVQFSCSRKKHISYHSKLEIDLFKLFCDTPAYSSNKIQRSSSFWVSLLQTK